MKTWSNKTWTLLAEHTCTIDQTTPQSNVTYDFRDCIPILPSPKYANVRSRRVEFNGSKNGSDWVYERVSSGFAKKSLLRAACLAGEAEGIGC